MNATNEPQPAASPEVDKSSPALDAPAPRRGDESVVAWDDLAQGRTRLFIGFEGQVYQLRVTRNGKLILTK